MQQATTRRPYGRMRVRYDQARLFYNLLWRERGEMTRSRALAKQDGQPAEMITVFNQQIALIDATKEELLRLVDEQGWSVDRHEPDEV